MPKAQKGRGKTSTDSRRNGSRIAISPSSITKVDAIAQRENKSRADVLEELIEQKYIQLGEENESSPSQNQYND